jgi:hypothetical protein
MLGGRRRSKKWRCRTLGCDNSGIRRISLPFPISPCSGDGRWLGFRLRAQAGSPYRRNAPSGAARRPCQERGSDMSSAWIIEGDLPAWRLRPSAESLPGSRLTFSVRRKTATRALRPAAVETTTGGTARSPSDPPFRDALIPSYVSRLQLSSRLGGRRVGS